MKVYVKENDCKSYADTTLDTKFPTAKEHDYYIEISKNSGVKKFKFDQPKHKYGKIMLTFETTENQFAQIKYMIYRSSSPLYLYNGQTLEGVFDPKIDKEGSVTPVFIRAANDYFLEIDIKSH